MGGAQRAAELQEDETAREYALVFFRLYARLGRGDARVLASALFGKFGGTVTGRERLLLHVQRVRHSPHLVVGEADQEDEVAFADIIAALEDRWG